MYDELVTVAEFQFGHEAHLTKTLLESEDIECFLADDNINRIYGGALTPVFGGVKLQVRSSDAERAGKILDDIEASDEELPPE